MNEFAESLLHCAMSLCKDIIAKSNYAPSNAANLYNNIDVYLQGQRIAALRASSEPATTVHNTDTPGHFAIITPALPAGTKLYTRPQPAPAEPVAWLHTIIAEDGEEDSALSFSPDNFPLEGVAGYRKVSCQPLYAQPAAAMKQGAAHG